jgi:IS5 family transposase
MSGLGKFCINPGQPCLDQNGRAETISIMKQHHALRHGEETDVFADAGYQGANQRPEATEEVNWHIAMRPGMRRALDRTRLSQRLLNQAQQVKAGIRAKDGASLPTHSVHRVQIGLQMAIYS